MRYAFAFSLPNTTDKLQPLNVSVNKLVKAFLQEELQEWYADEIMKQLDSVDDPEEAVLKQSEINRF